MARTRCESYVCVSALGQSFANQITVAMSSKNIAIVTTTMIVALRLASLVFPVRMHSLI